MKRYNKYFQKKIKNNELIINVDKIKTEGCVRFNTLMHPNKRKNTTFISQKWDISEVDLYHANFSSDIGFNICDQCTHCSGMECLKYKK